MKVKPFCSTTHFMNGYFFFLLISCFLITDTSAQTGLPVQEDSATWWYDGYTADPPSIEYRRLFFYYAEDTLVNGIAYQKLMSEHFTSFDNLTWIQQGSIPALVGIFRKDSLLNQYYLRQGESESLWYDFTLEVGDTLNTLQVMDDLTVIDSVDSIMVGTEMRKRWHLNIEGGTAFPYYIIEGIGNTGGLVNPDYLFLEAGSELFCFSEKGNALYPEEQTSCEKSILIGIKDELTELPLKVYPNPVANRLTLEWQDKLPRDGEWQICSMGGQIILREKIDFFNRLYFDMGHLPNGLYMLRLHAPESDFWYSKKISVQH